MSTIDERIVRARFDNADFERGVRQTLSSLSQLQKGMKLEGASKGLDDLGRAAGRFNLGNIASNVENIASKFTALGAIAAGALATIGSKAVQVGAQLLSSFSTSPILDGFHEYETNLNSIQTILANTGLEGKKGLAQVNSALSDLNTYSDKTIYNFSQMAHNIGTFTSAGVKLDVATGAIKGIANLAAISGSSADQASSAMYQLSQALASGTVKLIDWNSVVNAGMGGKVFQNALIETARNQGVAIDSIIKKNGSFRDSLQSGWLTDKVLTETLNKLTGDLTDTQLKAMGYTDKQIVGIQKLAKTAASAATDVRTASQLISTLQEALGSGWAQTFQTIFGDFGQSKTLFTNINNVLGGAIQQSSKARNKVLADWAKAGGRDALISAISNAFKYLGAIIAPIKAAFRDIFPPTTGAQLAAMSKGLLAFTQGLKIGADTADKIKRTFAGVFAVFHIGITIIKDVVKLFVDLFRTAGEGSGGFLDTTASIGDFLVALDKALTKGGALADFFRGLTGVLQIPIKAIQKLAGFLGNLFSGINLGAAAPAIAGAVSAVGSLANAGDLVNIAWTALGKVLGPVWDFFMRIGDKIGTVASSIANGFQAAFGGLDFGNILKTINTGLFAALVFGVRGFMSKLIGALSGKDSGPGIIDTIKSTFGQLTSTLQSMQNTLKAATLLQIAAAIGIMTLAVIGLSKIDAAGLTRSLTALTVMFGQLLGAMVVFEKIAGSKGMLKLPVVAAGLVILAVAVDILASAVKKLSDLNWEQLAKGLLGTTVLVGILVAAAKGLSGQGPGMVTAGLGLILLASAIRILDDSVAKLGNMNWENLAKGLIGTAGLLTGLALFSRLNTVNAGGIAQGAGIILLATGIKILASAVGDMGNLNWEQIAKGLLTMAGSLVAIGAALILIPPSSVLSAAAVLVVAASLGLVANALGQMGQMDWESIAKGLVALAGSLGIIAAALYLMTGALPGAAAMLVVAASLAILAPVLQSFGSMDWENIAKAMVTLGGALLIIAAAMAGMVIALPGAAALLVVAGALAILTPILVTLGGMSWESIAKGLLALAGAFLVIGVAGLLLAPLTPILIGLGAAITLMGLGMLAAGAGMLAFGVGLTAVAAAGAAASAILIGVVKALIALIPETMAAIGRGIVEFAVAIGNAGPALTGAMTRIMLSLLAAVAVIAPQVINTLLRMLAQFLASMLNYVPRIVSAGLQLVGAVLDGIARNIGQLVTKGADIIVNFLRGIQANQKRVIDEGVRTVIGFVNAVASAISSNQGAMNAAGARLGVAIADGMTGGIFSKVSSVVGAAQSMASQALGAVQGFLGIHSPSREFQKLGQYSVDGYVKGLDGGKDQINTAAKNMTAYIKAAMQNAQDDIGSLSKKLAKLKSAKHKDNGAIRDTTRALAQARLEYSRSAKAYAVSKTFGDELKRLNALADQQTAIGKKLDDARKSLADITKTRDDFAKSTKDQYATLPDLSGDTKLVDYVTELRQRIIDTRKFADAIQKLRSMGLNDDIYKQLLAKGVDALPFVQQLLDGGTSGIKDLNTLDSQLQTAAGNLGIGASHALYDAAVNAAAGLVKGLESQQAAIEKQMDKIAGYMIAAIKKALGIKSPSREFAAIGAYSVQGLAQGLKDSKAVTDAAEGVGKDAILAMQKSLTGLGSAVLDEINGSPTITPVLDLSSVVKDASQLDTILGGKPISVEAAYISAKGAQTGYDTNLNAQKDLTYQAAAPGPQYNFTQNNTSPKALSPAEIYRQTKNVVSKAKGAQ